MEVSEEIDAGMALLHQKRIHIRGKLNEHLPATQNLPPEVLTEIFQLSAYKLNLRELNCTRLRYRCFSNLALFVLIGGA